ncbi:hypothetical protein [Colwellia sp. E2M01]|uniref:hypothetical protein n=1 Tax=Colwellia sp. E2M01 TaxID=2841561 RepID=UPI001C099F4F|nr:hypothetical protein [Colwellia sp. E2M01]MBU2871522.1 hypothetical protein [Colwellia sp. E2M01]
MRLLSYLYQLKEKLLHLLVTSTSVTPQTKKTNYDHGLALGSKQNLKIKCQIAAKKALYINHFTHWPITKAKKDHTLTKTKNSLKYFSVTKVGINRKYFNTAMMNKECIINKLTLIKNIN